MIQRELKLEKSIFDNPKVYGDASITDGIVDNGKILTETDNRHKVRYNPVSRNPALKYSGGALHGHGEDPLSFDHNFDRSQPCFFLLNITLAPF